MGSQRRQDDVGMDENDDAGEVVANDVVEMGCSMARQPDHIQRGNKPPDVHEGYTMMLPKF